MTPDPILSLVAGPTFSLNIDLSPFYGKYLGIIYSTKPFNMPFSSKYLDHSLLPATQPLINKVIVTVNTAIVIVFSISAVINTASAESAVIDSAYR